MGATPSIQKPNSPSQGWPGIPFRYSGFLFLREDRETDIGFAGCPSAEPFGLRDGGLLLGEYTLLDELAGFAQRVGQRVARLDLDWKRNIGGHDEIMVLSADRNVLSASHPPGSIQSRWTDATEFAFLSRGPEWLRADPHRALGAPRAARAGGWTRPSHSGLPVASPSSGRGLALDVTQACAELR